MRTYLKHITASLCMLALITQALGQASSVRVVDNKGTVNKLGVFWSPVTAGAADIYNTDQGRVGIGTKTPLTALHVGGSVLFELEQVSNAIATYMPLSTYSGTIVTQTIMDCAVTLPAVTDAKPGRLFTLANAGASAYNLTCGGITITPGYAATFVWNGLSWSIPTTKAAVPLSGLLAAVNTNTIDNKDFAQTWNWSTATTQTPLALSAAALTTGNAFSITGGSTLTTGSLINATGAVSATTTKGLLNIANTAASATGKVATFQANSTASSVLTVLANGNVGLGTTTPNANALLDMTAVNKGMLPPRVVLDSTTSFAPLSAHVQGMLVYNTATAGTFPTNVIPGYYYNIGTKWWLLGGTGWAITGNAGTTPATNFMGTTDDQDVVFKRNNTLGGLLNLSLYNTSWGVNAFNTTATGNYNSAFGNQALKSNTTGTNNTAIGYLALALNATGTNNIALGANALKSNRATGNSAVGSGTLQANTNGTYNTAVGYLALSTNTTGTDNTAMGANALKSNTTTGITAVGSGALQANTYGPYSTAVGYQSMGTNTSGRYNTAIGNKALQYNTTSDYNVAVGYRALQANTTGGLRNTAVGYAALALNTTSTDNTAMGYSALSNATSYDNAALGSSAMGTNTTGGDNVAIGYQSLGSNTTGNLNVAIGNLADYLKTTGDNCIAIGSSATTGGNSNYIQLGNTNITSIGGHVGWSARSDKRVKRNIQENVPGLDFVLKLKPISYTFNLEAQDSITGAKADTSAMGRKSRLQAEAVRHTGFAAQDVEKVLNTLGYDFDGLVKPQNATDLYSLGYANFTVPLVKAVQEQQVTIQAQQKQIDAQQIVILAQQKLRQQRQLQINELMRRLDKLSAL